MRAPVLEPSSTLPTTRLIPISRLPWWRPWILALVAGGIAMVGGSGHSATSLLLEYCIRALAVVLVGVGMVAWVAGRRGSDVGYEVVPAMAGAIAGMTLMGSLAGTPYGPGGLGGDQTFRTAAVTRFADSWHNADFTVKGLPSFYPPAYFWVLGRAAALTGVEPWRMLKVGVIATAIAVPMVAFVLWRRVVPAHVAALVALVALVVENFYEPYSWLALSAFVPWWIEVIGYGVATERSSRTTVRLGLIGAALVMTYWYFFAIGVLAAGGRLISHRRRGTRPSGPMIGAASVAAVTAAASAMYWLPVVVSVLRAGRPESLGNRWFGPSHPKLPMPMLDGGPTAAVALVGLVYLAWTWGHDRVARDLLALLAAAYAWYLVGALAASLDHPLLTFRGKPMVPSILLSAGVIGLVRIAEFACGRWDRGDVGRVVAVLAAMLAVSATQGFVTEVRSSSYIESARAAADGDTAADADELERLIEGRVGDRAVLLTDRTDVVVMYPNHAFLPWDAHYAHPAAEFGRRIEFLTQLAASDDPRAFRQGIVDTPFGPIDALVLLDDGDDWVVRYGADVFPAGTRNTEIRFPKVLFVEFDVLPIGDHVLAIPR